MSQFPKAPRFPPEKPSEVPGPGLYNPKLHDPLDDHWRKGFLGIFKAPRSKEVDPGPDTFGIYNPDQSMEGRGAKPRPRAISTYASPSKQQTEILRMEVKLNERESMISTLNESLKLSEQTAKDTRKALQRCESDNQTLQSEVERLRLQIQKVGGLQRQFVQLQEEHDKSKGRRDKELVHLKSELRQAEDRAARYLTEKDQLKQSMADLVESREADIRTLQARSHQLNEHLMPFVQQIISQRDGLERSLTLTRDLARLDDVRNRKMVSDRASQVAELVNMMNDANARQESLYDVLDGLLETEDLAFKSLAEIQHLFQSERASHRYECSEVRKLLTIQQQIFEARLLDKQVDHDLLYQQAGLLQLELEDAQSSATSLKSTLSDLAREYSDLSQTCLGKVKELATARDDLTSRDSTIAQLSGSVSNLNMEIAQLKTNIRNLEETYSTAAEAWEIQKSEIQASLKQAQERLSEEQTQRSKISSELLMARQAEAALRSEVDYAQSLAAKLDEALRQVDSLTKANDLLARRSNFNAEEADKIAKLNADLVSQHNPAQRVRILNRMRQEIKEDKENTAKLQNELWVAQSEIESLKVELSAYQSVSHPAPIWRHNRRVQPPITSQTVEFSKNVRTPLQEVPNLDANLQYVMPQRSNEEPSEKIDEEMAGLIQGRLNPHLRPATNVTIARKPSKPPPKSQPESRIRKPRSLRNFAEPVAADLSQGAIKMQGKMTLDELR